MNSEKVPARHRNRATIACVACRKSRIRCNLDLETKTCAHCRNHNLDCIFDQRDGRKRCRATARRVAEVLSQRIEYLEGAIKHPTRSEAERAAAANYSAIDMCPLPDESPPAYDETIDPELREAPGQFATTAVDLRGNESISSMVRNLIPLPIQFSISSGRSRYFGSTANMGPMSRSCLAKPPNRQKSHWPIFTVVRDLSPETNRYLLDLYWTYHNAIIHLVYLDAFYEDQEEGGTEYYSTFLHLTMLATGLRYAEKKSLDTEDLGASSLTSSTLHEKAKAMAKAELDRSKGITTIQGLLLLGSLDFANGDDEAGWLHTGLALRSVFDVGLHVNPSSLELSERSKQIRHMVLWACLINDKFWSLYLGRPVTIKTSDIDPVCLSFDFNQLISCRSIVHEKKVGTKIYEALLRLMELVAPLCDTGFSSPPNTTEAYLKIAAMEQSLKRWYSSLGEDLRWPSDWQTVMPSSYFLLHAQYHTALILLHRTLIKYGDSHTDKAEPSIEKDDSFKHFTTMSRSICTESAKRIALIFEQYRSRFNIAQVYETALQQCGTAVTALMGELSLVESEKSCADTEVDSVLLLNLKSLRLTLSLMSNAYQPAMLMARVVDQFLDYLNVEYSEPAMDHEEVERPHTQIRKRTRAKNWAQPEGNMALSPPWPTLAYSGLEDASMSDKSDHSECWDILEARFGIHP